MTSGNTFWLPTFWCDGVCLEVCGGRGVVFVKDGGAVIGDEVWNSAKQCKQSTGFYVFFFKKKEVQHLFLAAQKPHRATCCFFSVSCSSFQIKI